MRTYLDHAATTPVRPEVAEQVAADLREGLGGDKKVESADDEAEIVEFEDEDAADDVAEGDEPKASKKMRARKAA